MMFAIIFSDIRNFNELRGKLHKTCRFKELAIISDIANSLGCGLAVNDLI